MLNIREEVGKSGLNAIKPCTWRYAFLQFSSNPNPIQDNHPN